MSQRYTLPEGLTNRDCEKSVSDRPPLPFVPLTTSTPEDTVFKNTGELRQLKIKLSEDLKVPKSIYDGGTPEQFLYHIQQTLDIMRKKLFKSWDSLELTRKEHYANLQSLRGELGTLKEQLSGTPQGGNSATGSKSGTGSSQQRTSKNTPRSERPDTDETRTHSHEREETHDPAALQTSIQELIPKKKSAKRLCQEVEQQQQVVMNEVFDLYDSLLSESQRGDWTKVVEDICHSHPYLTRRNKPRTGPRGQTKEAFHDCVHAHLLTVFSHDAAEQERHYLQCCLKKSPKVTIRQFISRMSQLNGYLSLLPCLYDSEYAINTTCRLDKPFTESELAQIVLDAVPATWRTQYRITHKTVPTDMHSLLTDLEKVERYVEATRAQEQKTQKKTEKGNNGTPSGKKPSQAGTKRNASGEEPIPRKKAKVTKMCQLCQQHGGAATTHNTKECRRYNKDGNLLASFGRGALKKSRHRIEEKKDTSKSSYAQLAKAITKAVKSSLKKSGKKRKHHSDTSDSSDSE